MSVISRPARLGPQVLINGTWYKTRQELAADAEAPDTEVRPPCSGAIASLQSGILSLFSAEQESDSCSPKLLTTRANLRD